MKTIKDFIEAGAYPTDEKGRALVPMRDGNTATILATDRGSCREPIVGWLPNSHNNSVQSWWAHGEHSRTQPSGWDLLPPVPRKVEVKAYAIIKDGRYTRVEHPDRLIPIFDKPGERTVELTGSYEEPW